ncbi:MAG: hypothetical protein ACLR9T_13280 [Thomasclavelia sp.]|uniref:hypothetical protein n=1 Tax=Thomasclavelia sp. TaxID=3025757 RepID=UPI0039A1C2F9
MNGISALKEELSYQTIEVQEEVIQAAGVRGKQEGVVLGQEGTPEGFANVLYKSLIELGEGKRTVRETQQLLDKEWDKRNENDQYYPFRDFFKISDCFHYCWSYSDVGNQLFFL